MMVVVSNGAYDYRIHWFFLAPHSPPPHDRRAINTLVLWPPLQLQSIKNHGISYSQSQNLGLSYRLWMNHGSWGKTIEALVVTTSSARSWGH